MNQQVIRRVVKPLVQPILKPIRDWRRKRRLHLVHHITYWCNYSCPYCYNTYHKGPRDTGVKPQGWASFYKSLPASNVDIAGGEPFFYDGFDALIIEMPNKHGLAITTNLSYDPRSKSEVFERFSSVVMSFHPHKVSLKQFIPKAKFIASIVPSHTVNIVAYPDLFSMLPKLKRAFEAENIRVHIEPYISDVPFQYTEEQKKILVEFNKNHLNYRPIGYISKEESKICNAGSRHFFLKYDGELYTCLGGSLEPGLRETYYLGNALKTPYRDLIKNQNIVCEIPCRWGCDLDHAKFKICKGLEDLN